MSEQQRKEQALNAYRNKLLEHKAVDTKVRAGEKIEKKKKHFSFI